LGNGLRFILTSGSTNEITQATALIQDFDVDYVIADKGYDSDEFVVEIAAQQAEAVIPPRSHRLRPREYDRHLYRERHLVECFINKIKHFRRVFSRFEKYSKNYLAFVYLASSIVWLR
jgi:transposase